MTTTEAAENLQCTLQHVRVLLRAGKLDGTKIGRDWFVSQQSLVEYTKTKNEDRQHPTQSVVREQRSLFGDVQYQPVVNVASVPQRSPFRYPGGKTWLIPVARQWLGSIDPKPRLLVEPFAGGGGIGLMSAFEGYTDRTLLVELDPDVAAVWRVMLQSEASELASRVEHFPCTLENVREVIARAPKTDVDRAFLTILRNRVSRGGILAPGAGLVKRGEANKGIASRWYPATLSNRIKAIHDRRSVLDFTEGDGLAVMQAHETCRDAAFFIDPPYPVAGKRLYRHHDLDHRRLFQQMANLEGPFLATYDNNPAVQALAKEFGFASKLVPMKSTHHEKKYELLIGKDLKWLSSADEVSCDAVALLA